MCLSAELSRSVVSGMRSGREGRVEIGAVRLGFDVDLHVDVDATISCTRFFRCWVRFKIQLR